MSNSYNLDHLILYSSCPLKYAYFKTGESPTSYDADHRTIITSALKDTVIKHFTLKGMGRSISATHDSRYFSKRWHEYRKNLTRDSERLKSATDLLVKAHERVLSINNIFPSNYEIAAVNFPTEMSVKSCLITSSIDLLFIDKDNTRDAFIIFLDTSIRKKTENDLGSFLKATFNLSATSRDLIDSRVNVRCLKYNLLHNYKKEIKLTREHRTYYPKIISGITKCIESESFYPRASLDACEHCTYKDICSWKIK